MTGKEYWLTTTFSLYPLKYKSNISYNCIYKIRPLNSSCNWKAVDQSMIDCLFSYLLFIHLWQYDFLNLDANDWYNFIDIGLGLNIPIYDFLKIIYSFPCQRCQIIVSNYFWAILVSYHYCRFCFFLQKEWSPSWFDFDIKWQDEHELCNYW